MSDLSYVVMLYFYSAVPIWDKDGKMRRELRAVAPVFVSTSLEVASRVALNIGDYGPNVVWDIVEVPMDDEEIQRLLDGFERRREQSDE